MLEWAFITSTDSVLLLTTQLAAPADIEPQAVGQHSVQASLEAVEKQHIMNVLEAADWRISGPQGAATILGINPSTLRFRMNELGITKNS